MASAADAAARASTPQRIEFIIPVFLVAGRARDTGRAGPGHVCRACTRCPREERRLAQHRAGPFMPRAAFGTFQYEHQDFNAIGGAALYSRLCSVRRTGQRRAALRCTVSTAAHCRCPRPRPRPRPHLHPHQRHQSVIIPGRATPPHNPHYLTLSCAALCCTAAMHLIASWAGLCRVP